MDSQFTSQSISVKIKYDDRKAVDAGSLVCRVQTGNATVELKAIANQPFPPFNDLTIFLESIVRGDLPCQTYWDEEDLQNELFADPLESSTIFRFRLYTAASFHSDHDDHDEHEPDPTIEGVVARAQFVSAFADALLDFCQNAPEAAKQWQIDRERIALLKSQ